MEIITVESEAFKTLNKKLDDIYAFINLNQGFDISEEWVESSDVSKYLKISERTLQRLRAKKEISYTPIHGKNFYQIKEIRRMLKDKLIKSKHEYLDELVKDRQDSLKRMIK